MGRHHWPQLVENWLWHSRWYWRVMEACKHRAWYIERWFRRETEMADWTWRRARGARFDGNGILIGGRDSAPRTAH